MTREVAVLWSEPTNPPTASSKRYRFDYGTDLKAALREARTGNAPDAGLVGFVRAGSGELGSTVFDPAAVAILYDEFVLGGAPSSAP